MTGRAAALRTLAVAAVLACPGRAAAYRPFTGTDAAVAAKGDVELEGTRLRVVPKRNKGPKWGFQEMREDLIELPSAASPAEIGRAIDQALERCR